MKKMNSKSAIGIGVAVGVALGAAFDNIGLGLAIGVAIGAAWGTRIDSQNKDKPGDK